MNKNSNPPCSNRLILGWIFFHIPQTSDHFYCLESSFLTAWSSHYLLQLLHVLIQLLGDPTHRFPLPVCHAWEWTMWLFRKQKNGWLVSCLCWDASLGMQVAMSFRIHTMLKRQILKVIQLLGRSGWISWVSWGDIWSDNGEKKAEQMQRMESKPLILVLPGTEPVKELLRAET